MPIRESSYGYWSSNRAFIYVAAGAAIGIGNLARLPYLASLYGGSVFLLAYVVALLLLTWPLLVLELSLGRYTRGDPVSGLRQISEASGARREWVWAGGLALACAVMVLSYYSVIAGWSLAYTMRAASGVLQNAGAEGLREIFYALAQDAERSLAWHTIFMVTACVVVAQGALDGIERAARYLVPAAFVMVLLLFLYALGYGDGPAVLSNLLSPAPERFGWRGLMEAIHQAFFTLALGLGAMFVCGSYLPAKAPVARLALYAILFDAVFGLLGGVALYSLVFAAGLDPAPGLTLLFQVFPLALPDNAGGLLAGTALYLVYFFITLTAATALMEPVTRYLMDYRRVPRVFAATAVAVAIWFLGLGTLLSFNVLKDYTLFGNTLFDWLQLATALLLPASALAICVFASRILPAAAMAELWGEQPPWLRRVWAGLLRYPVRMLLLLLLLYVSGAVEYLVTLWS